MGTRIEIGILDTDAARAERTQGLVDKLLREMDLATYIESVIMVPGEQHAHLSERYPVLEAGGDFWSIKPGRDFTEDQLSGLLHHLLATGIIPL